MSSSLLITLGFRVIIPPLSCFLLLASSPSYLFTSFFCFVSMVVGTWECLSTCMCVCVCVDFPAVQ
ncbi:MAG: hypothetical protein JOS17DRAFT_765042 [Linnemannia elongata]|nr:MAG: hypothetical protein JOS17DRAFT_765042 [Linnemannia elongata]